MVIAKRLEKRNKFNTHSQQKKNQKTTMKQKNQPQPAAIFLNEKKKKVLKYWYFLSKRLFLRLFYLHLFVFIIYMKYVNL